MWTVVNNKSEAVTGNSSEVRSSHAPPHTHGGASFFRAPFMNSSRSCYCPAWGGFPAAWLPAPALHLFYVFCLCASHCCSRCVLHAALVGVAPFCATFCWNLNVFSAAFSDGCPRCDAPAPAPRAAERWASRSGVFVVVPCEKLNDVYFHIVDFHSVVLYDREMRKSTSGGFQWARVIFRCLATNSKHGD